MASLCPGGNRTERFKGNGIYVDGADAAAAEHQQHDRRKQYHYALNFASAGGTCLDRQCCYPVQRDVAGVRCNDASVIPGEATVASCTTTPVSACQPMLPAPASAKRRSDQAVAARLRSDDHRQSAWYSCWRRPCLGGDIYLNNVTGVSVMANSFGLRDEPRGGGRHNIHGRGQSFPGPMAH